MNIELDKDHLYSVDGEPFPSVTYIIKSVVPVPFEKAAWWGYRVARQGLHMEEKRNSAALLGTKAHRILEDIANGWEPKVDATTQGFHEAIQRFMDRNDPEFHDTEERTASMQHRYAGTLDAFVTFRKGKYKGASARVDLKTGRHYPESHWPQLEAYEFAEVERGKEPSDFRFVLKITPAGSYRLIQSTDTFEDFLVLLNHFRSAENRKARR